MQSYHVTLNFTIAFGECNPTSGQTPPNTPEEIGDLNSELLMVCEREEPNDIRTRLYRCEMLIVAKSDDAAGQILTNMFKHLPLFEVVAVIASPVKSPPASDPPPTRQVRVLFESDVAWMTLSRAFQTISPPVSIAAAGSGVNQYTVICDIECVDASEAIERVRRICKECCGVTDDPATEINYREKEAVVISRNA